MENQNAKELLEKYEAGTCTPQEKQLVESWYLHTAASRKDNSDMVDYERVNREMKQALQIKGRSRTLYHQAWPLTAAAVLLASMAAILYFYNPKTANHIKKSAAVAQKTNDIPPGGNHATLTLADGRTIVLDQAANGQIAKEAGIKITKTSDEKIVYESLDFKNESNKQPSAITYNKITTPKGGQYLVILPDGSKVWLNAASSLKYPTAFVKKERRVFLTGEAYFEVKKNPAESIPFIVSTMKQEVEVLGTHFNINAYEDENDIRTTLLEGRVRVTATSDRGIKPVVLKPDMQSIFSDHHMKTAEADVEAITAWKNGFFQFNDADMPSIMRQLARWYAIDVDYETLPNLHFNGTISRNVNISKVLNMLELTGNIKFKIKGNKIYIQ